MSLLLSGLKNPRLLWVKLVENLLWLWKKSCGSFCNIWISSLHWRTVQNSKDKSKLRNHMVFFPSHYIFYLCWNILVGFIQPNVDETFARLEKVRSSAIVFSLLVIVVEQIFCFQKGLDKIYGLLWKRKKKMKRSTFLMWKM